VIKICDVNLFMDL